MDRRDTSEVVFGLVLSGKIAATHVNANHLIETYAKGLKILVDGGDDTDIVDKLGLAPYQTAKEAASMVDQEVDWLVMLERAYSRDNLANILEKQMKTLRRGEDADALAITSAIERNINFGDRYVTLDKVKPEESVWRKTGYQPIDEHIGGLPDPGLTVIAAPPGTGKTSLLLSLAQTPITENKDVLIYSLEMSSRQILYRLMQLNNYTQEQLSHIEMCEEMIGVDDILADVGRKCASKKYHFIGIDFADLMLRGNVDEPQVGHIYVTCAIMAKLTNTPIILLSQLNREYVGGIPRIHNIRWSGLAEAVASMILLIYNPKATWTDYGKQAKLPAVEGYAYIICGKSRYGFKDGMNAISIEWTGETGWGKQSSGLYPL